MLKCVCIGACVLDSAQAYATASRRARRQPSRDASSEQLLQQQQQQQPNADDIVDISYVGGNIPSRTFRMLQQAVSTRAPQGISTSDRLDIFSCRWRHSLAVTSSMSLVSTEMVHRSQVYRLRIQPSHPGRLSLAIPPWVGKMSTGDGYGHR